ncbi:MAG: hypothetical protein KKE44_09575 [Proteobacteria bacterium]|nr:hypothetical protein [Pseudomonadota bacterium]MBU1582973.1 hypothetical protein [Pseudomonadota bacterium]MBU2452510.1 hypothetical protein [Pseudomonadota bacterium]MBU2631766.1 hypothetical protein [Pseudomonadota bacterium]
MSLLVPVLVLAGCAGHVSYDALSAHLSAGDCNAAARLIEDSRGDYGTHSELLFFLDSAMVHMQCKNFQAAQERFHSAEDLAQQLWTTSLSREAVSLISNDYLISYGGEDYERAMIHLMSAIAYLDAENFEDALVECRRLDSLLTLYNDRYAEKNVYKEDAFGRYLSGILNEADHNLDAAFIDYQKALESYADYEQFYQTPAPSSLKKDFLRVARAVNRVADARNLIPGDVPDSEILYKTSRTMGEILVIQLTGRAPVKVEDRVHIPTIHGPITLAFPKFLPVSSAPPRTSFLLRSRTEQKEIQADLAADITAIAFKNLADHRARIITKTIARAAVKQAVIRQAAKKVAKNENKDTQQAIEIALNLMNLFLEHADLRSWQTLPARVYMARAFVEQGAYELEIPSQVNGRRKIKNIMVTAGKIHYIIETDSPGL